MRKALDMERLRTLEAMHLEQQLQMRELDEMAKPDALKEKQANDEYARMCAFQDAVGTEHPESEHRSRALHPRILINTRSRHLSLLVLFVHLVLGRPVRATRVRRKQRLRTGNGKEERR